MNILVTGGAGYIGSHTIIELLGSGHQVIVADNLSNSSQESLNRIESITSKKVDFYHIDIGDREKLEEVFSRHTIDAVIHFAGLKAVGESVEKPLLYYQNNVGSTLVLLDIMKQHDVKKLVFSSTATVYGSADFPYREDSPTGQGIIHPYGQTKYMIERILSDLASTDPSYEFTVLRYFNPIGAHPSGLIGEYPNGIPNNLMPYITQVATGQREKLRVFGNDYDTVDSTGVRDYIHVSDLARGHLTALTHAKPGFHAYNLGTGKGVSVLQLVDAFEKASGKEIPYEIVPRRPGDLPEFYADASLAKRELGWKTQESIETACRDSWNWISKNPHGYESIQL